MSVPEPMRASKLAVLIERSLTRTTVPSPTEEAAILVTAWPSTPGPPSRSSTTNGTSSIVWSAVSLASARRLMNSAASAGFSNVTFPRHVDA